MPILHAIILGITQGLAEFLPISSSGHLGLVPWAFGWNDFEGQENLAKAFDVALHVGTLSGSIAYFWRDLIGYAKAGLGEAITRKPLSTDGRIAWLLVATAVPAGITGVALESVINEIDDVIWLIGLMLIIFGLVLLYADRLGGSRQTEDFQFRDAMAMGFGQAFALMPGVSRSGVTITVSRKIGFSRDAAARLSFLMSLPVIAGAGVFKALDVAADGGIPSDFVPAFLWGMGTSAITGYAAVWGTLRFIRTRTFTPFVIYRVVVGVLVIGLVAIGFRG